MKIRDQIANTSESLSIQAAEARTRARSAIERFYDLRQGVYQTRAQSKMLWAACQEIRLQCRATRSRTSTERVNRIPRGPESAKLAHAIVGTLLELGVPAFLYRPPQDTAMRQ